MSFSNSKGCPECRHIFPNGKRCHAAALRGMPLCYFHSRNKSVINENRNRGYSVALPPLEDRGSIQIAVNEVLAAHAAGKIDRKGIWPYLVGIQIASRNLTEAKDDVVSPDPVEQFEEHFGESLAPPDQPGPDAEIVSEAGLCLDRVQACAHYTCATHEYDPEPLPVPPEPKPVKLSRWYPFNSRNQLNRFKDCSEAWCKGFFVGRSGVHAPGESVPVPEQYRGKGSAQQSLIVPNPEEKSPAEAPQQQLPAIRLKSPARSQSRKCRSANSTPPQNHQQTRQVKLPRDRSNRGVKAHPGT